MTKVEMTGNVDAAIGWDTALSDEEITQLFKLQSEFGFQSSLSVKPENIVFYWRNSECRSLRPFTCLPL